MNNDITNEVVSGKPTVLANARELIAGKTRFESKEIQAIYASEDLVSYQINVQYDLDATPTTQNITGNFSRSQVDIKTSDPVDDATNEVAMRLIDASNVLQNELVISSTKYNQIEPGLLLKHKHKYWHLHTCRNCSGTGQNKCGICSGSGETICYKCFGSSKIPCDNSGCVNGRVNCNVCYGKGSTSHQVAYQTSYSEYYNGSYHTRYRTEYRTEYQLCRFCSYGKVSCVKCSGTAKINCQICYATGRLSCHKCAGSGIEACQPCDGSGEVGLSTWVDVHITNQNFSLNTPDGTPNDVLNMIEKEGLHGLPSISENFNFVKTILDSQNSILATYYGEFRVARQDVICKVESAHLIAYGNDLRWWSLDGIIERLLQDDLNVLLSTIVESSKDGIFSCRIDHLLENLKNIFSSEINIDIIESTLSDKNVIRYREAVSDEYAKNVKQGMQVALRRVHLRSAKRSAWMTPLIGSVFGISVWAFEGAMWAAISTIIVFPFSLILHKLSIRKLLTNIFGQAKYTNRVIYLSGKFNAIRNALFLLSIPSVILSIGMGFGLPEKQPLTVNELSHVIPLFFSEILAPKSNLYTQLINKGNPPALPRRQ